MNHLLLIAVLLFGVASVTAQEPDKGRNWTFGTELDVFPYATGGWYASLFGAYENIRLRSVVAQSNLPGFVRDEGINEQRVQAYAGIIDFVFGRDNRGPTFDQWWLGFGYERWETTYVSADGMADVSTNVLTVGGGYIWKFWKGFYLNPWVAAHVSIDNTEPIQVGSITTTPPGVLPEASLKIGWMF